MSNPSTQQKSSKYPDADFPPWWIVVPFFLVCGGALPAAIEIGTRLDAPARALREQARVQEWRLAHKDVVQCDFGNGISFSVKSQKPEDVPESTRPLLAEGLASGACSLPYAQNAQS